MTSEITLPPLGEHTEEGEVVAIKVGPGDEIKPGQTLVEIEAEKATVEVPAPFPARIAKILVQKGDRVHAGQALFVVETHDGPSAPMKAEESRQTEPQQNPPLAPIAPTTPPPATAIPQVPPVENRPVLASPQRGPGSETLVPAGPATRRLARELGIDLGSVPGSAPFGRVTQDDVKAYVRKLAVGHVGIPGAAKAQPLPDFSNWGPIEHLSLEPIRRRMAEQMALSWSLVPHVTQHDLADITEIEAFRKQQEGKGPKLTVTAFVLKAVSVLLRQLPRFNSSLDAVQNRLILKRYYHLGVAVDTEHGLVVPVIRDVDKKSVHDLAVELAELAERGRQRKLAPDELRGGTFTISNLGGIGGIAFTPIVNYPEVAILGLSRARIQPLHTKDSQFVPRLLLPLSLSYDHRVIDGAEAARFIRRLAEMLENPMMLLIHA
jgi:pyruvate dehydrogenase E2 component (dihydrolipoamide acetyltransferase)